jgi:hypothetical protein
MFEERHAVPPDAQVRERDRREGNRDGRRSTENECAVAGHSRLEVRKPVCSHET